MENIARRFTAYSASPIKVLLRLINQSSHPLALGVIILHSFHSPCPIQEKVHGFKFEVLPLNAPHLRTALTLCSSADRAVLSLSEPFCSALALQLLYKPVKHRQSTFNNEAILFYKKTSLNYISKLLTITISLQHKKIRWGFFSRLLQLSLI